MHLTCILHVRTISEETWSWGGIRQRVKGKSSEGKACEGKACAEACAAKVSNGKLSSGASRDRSKGSGPSSELSPSVESSYVHSPTVEHALPQLAHDAPQPFVSGVPAKGRVAGSSSASGWWGGVSVIGSKGVGSKVGADTAEVHCEKGKVYGGGSMPPGFVFQNGQLRVKVGQDDDRCGADCPLQQKVTCLWHETSETSQSSVSNVHTKSSEPNPQSTAAKHTRKESIDFQDCVDGGGGHGLVHGVVDDDVVDGGVVDDGVVESPASPCLTDMSDIGDAQDAMRLHDAQDAMRLHDAQDAMRHHSLRWHEEQTPGALTAASQSGCWDMALVKKPCNMPPEPQVKLKCIVAPQSQAMPPAPHVCRSSASRPAARVASTDSIETMFTHIKNHHLARMSSKDQDALKDAQGVTVEFAKGGNRDAHFPLHTPPLTPSFHDSVDSLHAGVSVSEDTLGGIGVSEDGGIGGIGVSEDAGASNSSASKASASSASQHAPPLSASQHAPPFKGAPGSNVQAAKEAEAVQVVGGSSSKALNKSHSELRIERLFQAFEEQPCEETGAHWRS